MRKFIYIWLLCVPLAHGALNPQARLTQLTHEIRCVVCQNQSVADSDAPLARDLRQKIAELIAQQMTDEAIKDYLVKRYGEFILLKPRLSRATLLLWVFPFVGLGVIAWQLFRKNMLR